MDSTITYLGVSFLMLIGRPRFLASGDANGRAEDEVFGRDNWICLAFGDGRFRCCGGFERMSRPGVLVGRTTWGNDGLA
jgi:hypothetical protein